MKNIKVYSGAVMSVAYLQRVVIVERKTGMTRGVTGFARAFLRDVRVRGMRRRR